MSQTVVIASDHAGVELKSLLCKDVAHAGYVVEDLGPADTVSVDYPDYAKKLCEWVLAHPGSKGILICGSGIGMSIAANRYSGIRAALVHHALEASLTRRHNDANVLCLGARMIGADVARDAVTTFLTTEFEGGRHAARVAKLTC